MPHRISLFYLIFLRQTQPQVLLNHHITETDFYGGKFLVNFQPLKINLSNHKKMKILNFRVINCPFVHFSRPAKPLSQQQSNKKVSGSFDVDAELWQWLEHHFAVEWQQRRALTVTRCASFNRSNRWCYSMIWTYYTCKILCWLVRNFWWKKCLLLTYIHTQMIIYSQFTGRMWWAEFIY